MGVLAALCGALLIAFGLLTTRRAPTDAQFGVEVTCLVGGLVLIFLGVLLSRLGRIARRLAASEAPPGRSAADHDALQDPDRGRHA